MSPLGKMLKFEPRNAFSWILSIESCCKIWPVIMPYFRQKVTKNAITEGHILDKKLQKHVKTVKCLNNIPRSYQIYILNYCIQSLKRNFLHPLICNLISYRTYVTCVQFDIIPHTIIIN
jgi:hypothetical protein